jgi:glutaconate CoA-transferase subunit B
MGRGRVTRTFLEAPIVDRRGNVNTTVIGDYDQPTVRLPGSGGGTELGSLGRGLTLMCNSVNARSFPEKVDYVTSPGHLGAAGDRDRLGYPHGRGPGVLVTPLGRLGFREGQGFTPTGFHRGVSWDDLSACFRWLPAVSVAEIGEIADPTPAELAATRHVLREARTNRYRLDKTLTL